jgi:hypothetical protein
MPAMTTPLAMSSTVPARGSAGRSPRRRRGTAYLLVLIVSMLVLVIGLSALLNAQARGRVSGSVADQMIARVLAISAVDLAVYELAHDSNWRATYASGEWQPKRNIDGEDSVTFRLVDEDDGDLLGGTLLPVRLHGLGESHDAIQVCSVLIGATGPNLIDNNDIESGLEKWDPYNGSSIVQETTNAYAGAASAKVNFRPAATSGIEQSVKGEVVSGASYYCEVWIRPNVFDQDMRIRIDMMNDAAVSSSTYFDQAAPGNTWTLVQGVLTPTWTGSLVAADWRVETVTGTSSYVIDEVRLEMILAQPEVIEGSWRQEILP